MLRATNFISPSNASSVLTAFINCDGPILIILLQ